MNSGSFPVKRLSDAQLKWCKKNENEMLPMCIIKYWYILQVRKCWFVEKKSMSTESEEISSLQTLVELVHSLHCYQCTWKKFKILQDQNPFEPKLKPILSIYRILQKLVIGVSKDFSKLNRLIILWSGGCHEKDHLNAIFINEKEPLKRNTWSFNLKSDNLQLL